MLLLDNASIERLAIHFVGNKTREEGVVLGKKVLNQFSTEEEQVLWKFFLAPFKNVSEFHRFTHSSDVSLNDMRKFCSEVFEKPGNLGKASEKMAKLLYECSTHAKVNRGELYVTYLSGCVVGETELNAIGIFKSESKESFLKANANNEASALLFDAGTSSRNIDKACIVFCTEDEDEFKICLSESSSRSTEALYWKDDFLKIEPCADDYHHTRNYMNVAKNFVTSRLSDDFDVSKTDQIAYLNKSVDYFKQNETFNEAEFASEVFEDKNVIRSFREFKTEYAETNSLEIEEDFDISAPAVKKQAKVFKSVLKLDKNFHIYIHGRQDYIEKGTEKDGRKFYKIYYSEES
jgi:hypothetical protein